MNDDLISRKSAIDEVKRLHDVALANWKETRISANTMIDALKDLPSAQLEPTLEQIEEYCHKRCLSIVDNALLHKYAQPATSCSEFPNTSDVVSRKAVREMVATWSYDMAELEDVELALHDVDELPLAKPEVIHCKDCKHYRTTGAFGVPLHKEEYFCDADNYPKNDPGEEQRELPEWWFCAGAERKENGYTLDCQTCDLENHSGFKMRDRFTTVPKDVYEKMQMDDLREEQEERLGVAPILYPKAK